MTRSLVKGPYIAERLLKKIEGKTPAQTGIGNMVPKQRYLA